MRNLLFGLPAALALLFAPQAAQADHENRGSSVHVHSHACAHAPAPAPRQDGRYELRTYERWVEGRWLERYEPGRCKHKRHHTQCKPGRMVSEWVPGRYEPVQEWVFVPAPRPLVRVSLRF
jgi:hypothetical protein